MVVRIISKFLNTKALKNIASNALVAYKMSACYQHIESMYPSYASIMLPKCAEHYISLSFVLLLGQKNFQSCFFKNLIAPILPQQYQNLSSSFQIEDLIILLWKIFAGI